MLAKHLDSIYVDVWYHDKFKWMGACYNLRNGTQPKLKKVCLDLDIFHTNLPIVNW